MGGKRGLFFVLLISFLGTLHAQSRTSCGEPKLDHGYFNSAENNNDSTTRYYGCNKGLKPVSDSWWGISECKNGEWSPQPRCIDENACITPENINAKVKNPISEGWYQNEKKISFECVDNLYKITWPSDATCLNGAWTRLPVCEKTKDWCGEPPHVSNAVITQEYSDMYSDSSEVKYKCRTLYSLNSSEPVFCISGVWTPTLTCLKDPSPTEKPNQGVHEGKPNQGVHEGKPNQGGVAQIPTGRPSGPFVPVDKCGEKPVVENGDFIYDSNRMALTYKCNLYYKLVGPEQVMCHSNGVWSKTPVCKKPCTVSPTENDLLYIDSDVFLKEGESQMFYCKQQEGHRDWHQARLYCQDGKLNRYQCTLDCILEKARYPQLDLKEDKPVGNGRYVYIKCLIQDSHYYVKKAYVLCQSAQLQVEPCG
ncbi:hypothetical protein DPEC_G00055980 [Dallia pectoralis]|uniref:Uncharacterized protein n=1 Tax=Dallia pectoralis TaxID=75939 RepID=A0ACC2H6S6_DALPE|nr:hypothetical protein DPEC_G00055980 [Dallia pectoralis]